MSSFKNRYEALDWEGLDDICAYSDLSKQESHQGIIDCPLALHEANCVRDDKKRAIAPSPYTSTHHTSVAPLAASAAADSSFSPPTRAMSWADEKQEEVDTADAAKAKVTDSDHDTEDEDRWQTVTKPKQSSCREKVKAEAAGDQNAELIKEGELTDSALATIIDTRSTERVEDVKVLQVTMAEQEEESIAMPAPINPSSKPGTGTTDAVDGPQSPIAIEEEQVVPALPTDTTVNDNERATPGSDSWEDFISSTPVVFNSLRLAPETISSASSSAGTSSYAAVASSENGDSKITTDTELEGSNVLSTNKKKNPSGAQCRKAMKAAAVAESSSDAATKPIVVVASAAKDIQETVSVPENVAKPIASPSMPDAEPTATLAKSAEGLQSATSATEKVEQSAMSPFSPVTESTIGNAAKSASTGIIPATSKSGPKPAAAGGNMPESLDVGDLQAATTAVAAEPGTTRGTPAIATEESQLSEKITEEVIIVHRSADEPITIIFTKDGAPFDHENFSVEPFVARKKKNKPSGAQRRKAVKQASAASTVAPPAVPAVSVLPAVPVISVKTMGVQAFGYTVPWFVVLALSTAQLVFIAIGLHCFM